ncbi:hypothetical protein B7H23_08245 [Notoacmeibacter marinus]|uniref:DUF4864 domain-containing protein n=1 Tax=Notoacmeibacter marinus TaxID=1876515 RepID=A0A231UW86_9HYPH|nr:DUF4864 domain-containing protein [Notoacmeibacter marinus]OXT00164.1 hypothetical protein B7H23_08245 [Notoacmeibacter marinus]
MKPYALGLFALSFVLSSTIGALSQDTAPWQGPIDDQLQSFQSDNGARAYSHAAPNIRRMFPTLERFMSMVEGGYPQVRKPKSWTMGPATPLSDDLIAQEVIIVGPTGKVWKALYTLQQQADGNWQISGVSLQGLKSFGV